VARPTPVRRAWRSLIILGVIVLGLIGANLASVLANNGSWAPRLALDLEGGTQLILAAQVADGQQVTQDQLNQAVSIIRSRVDAAGVSEAEVTTQGDRNVVVSIPGTPDDATLARIQSTSQLEFRPVLLAGAGTPAVIDDGSGETPAPTDGAVPGTDGSATPSPSESAAADTPTPTPTDGSDLAQVTPAVQEEYDSFDCASLGESDTNVAPPDRPLVTCELNPAGDIKYLLGPVEVSGEDLTDATAGQRQSSQGFNTGEWAVNLTFNGAGTDAFRTISERLVGLESPRNQFGIVLDGRVISAPSMNAVITDGRAEISGSFTQESAQALGDQLRFGALPIGFQLQSSEAISATLGTNQLASGLLAGVIGLVLVIAYSLFQYRTLGVVTIASLVVATIVTYLVTLYLSNEQGYRLSLAGVAGLVVAIGITADSFIVYFERLRDELRDGRSLASSVENGWRRALRTILASDAVSLLAAIVLYVLAIGNVRGFAFTLGVTTVVDVLVVTLFTHPMLQLLSRLPFFSEGHRLSGLDPKALGAVYRGRAQFRTPVAAAGRGARASGEAQRRQTIAQRRVAEEEARSATRRGGTATKTREGEDD